MSTALDRLITKGLRLEAQKTELEATLKDVRQAIAQALGEEKEYFGQHVMAKKWPHVRYEINSDLLLDALDRDELTLFKEVVFNKTKLDQALRGGAITPHLYDRAVTRLDKGWMVSFKAITRGAKA